MRQLINSGSTAQKFPNIIFMELIHEFILSLKPHWAVHKSLMIKCNRLKEIITQLPKEDQFYNFETSDKFTILKQIECINFIYKNKENCNALLVRNSLNPINDNELTYLKELLDSLTILTRGINFMLKGSFWSFFLPTLFEVKKRFQKLNLNNSMYTSRSINYILQRVKQHLNSYHESTSLGKLSIVAACFHPRFKLDWMSGNDSFNNLKRICISVASEYYPAANINLPERNDEDDEDNFISLDNNFSRNRFNLCELEITKFVNADKTVELDEIKRNEKFKNIFFKFNSNLISSNVLVQMFDENNFIKINSDQPKELNEKLFILRLFLKYKNN